VSRGSRPRSSVSHRWVVVWSRLECFRGHVIRAGASALFTRVSALRLVRCVACAKVDYGWDPPGSDNQAVDFKMRQAGDAS